MKPRNVVWCPRSKHRLAWLEFDATSGELLAVATLIAPGRNAGTVGPAYFPAGDVRGGPEDPYTTHQVDVSCPCGDRWTLDLVALLDGRPQALTRHSWRFPGVSWRRERHKGR